MNQTDETHRPGARTGDGAWLPGGYGDGILSGRRDRITRRAALSALAGGIAFGVGLRSLQPLFGIADTLPALGERLAFSIEEDERWIERRDILDSSISQQLLDRYDRREPMADAELTEWHRSIGIDFAERQAKAAWERTLATEREIAAATATDVQGLMVQAQAFATRFYIGVFPHERRLAASFIHGLTRLRPADEVPSASDDHLHSACRDWNAALDELLSADRDLHGIQLPDWASGSLMFVPDSAQRMMIEAEQRRTGYRAALERLWAAQDRLITVEEAVASTTATTFTALLAQARPMARRIHIETGCLPYLLSEIGTALLRGVERLGGRRIAGLVVYSEIETDEVPVPTAG